jgi:hypothetical protein
LGGDDDESEEAGGFDGGLRMDPESELKPQIPSKKLSSSSFVLCDTGTTWCSSLSKCLTIKNEDLHDWTDRCPSGTATRMYSHKCIVERFWLEFIGKPYFLLEKSAKPTLPPTFLSLPPNKPEFDSTFSCLHKCNGVVSSLF